MVASMPYDTYWNHGHLTKLVGTLVFLLWATPPGSLFSYRYRSPVFTVVVLSACCSHAVLLLCILIYSYISQQYKI